MQSIDSIETYAHRMSKNLVCKKEEIKCNDSNNLIETYANGINKDLVNEKEEIKCNNTIK